MALKRLTTAEMVQISGPWTTNGSPVRKVIQSIPELAGVLPKLDAAHKQLHAARPAEEDPRVGEIVLEAAEVDARHDAVVRGVDLVLEGLAFLAGDSPRSREIEAARGVLTPDGVKVIATSYRNEAGAAALLESRLGSEAGVKALLASIVVDKKKTLTTFVNERIELAEKLGALEDERAKLLTAPTASGAANVSARNGWIRAVNALLANAELAELPPEQSADLFGALRQAEAKADRRGKAAPAEPTPGPADPIQSDPGAKAHTSGAPASSTN
jgi:hypothetical protein